MIGELWCVAPTAHATVEASYGVTVGLQPSDGHYRNTLIRLTDLAVTEEVLSDLTFEGCDLVGPAVILPLGTTEISNCKWDGTPESIFWIIPRNREILIGAIGLANCQLIGCRLRNIGLAIPEDALDNVRQGFGL